MFDLIRCDSHAELGRLAGSLAAEAISAAHDAGREAKVLLAAAPSQLPILRELADTDVHGQPVQYFQMDDYTGLVADAPQAFGTWLEDNYFARLPQGNRARFERIPSSDDPQHVATAYASLLPAGDFDLVLCGIGVNGHLAFNDPGSDLADPEPVRHIELAEASRRQQVHEGLFGSLENVPKFAITLTVPRILAARTIVCSVLGEAKAEALKALTERPVTTELPATALKQHPRVTVLADNEALSHVD